MEPTEPQKPIRSSVQWTPEQYAWLHAEVKRLGLRSIAAYLSMMVQERMHAQYRASGIDADVEQ